MIIGYLIGVLIAFILYMYLKDMQWDWRYNSDELIAKWLSKDKPFERYNGGYIIYANSTRWYIETFGGCRLIWCPEADGGIDVAIKEGMVEFQASWLDKHEMYKLMKKIIYTHPNLTSPNWYWSLVKSGISH